MYLLAHGINAALHSLFKDGFIQLIGVEEEPLHQSPSRRATDIEAFVLRGHRELSQNPAG